MLKWLWSEMTDTDGKVAIFVGIIPVAWFFTGASWLFGRYPEEDFLAFVLGGLPLLIGGFGTLFVGAPLLFRRLEAKMPFPGAVISVILLGVVVYWIGFEISEEFYELGEQARRR